ncbi:MAG: hypothetical protein JW818_01320 [Pirellulales bacterium]|nr:hypothetical protein [Pirellulales bacterium]
MKDSLRFSVLALLVIAVGLPAVAWAATGDVVQQFAAPYRCSTGMTFDGKSLWVADRRSDMLYQVDPKTGKVLRSMPAPSHQVSGLTWYKNRLWVLDSEVPRVHCFNPETGVTERSIEVSCSRPCGLASDGKFLWVGRNGHGRHGWLYQISTEDGTTVHQMPSPATDTRGLTFDGKYLWVADRLDDMIYMVHPDRAGTVIQAFDSPSKFPCGLAFDGKYLWNVDYESDQIYKLVARDDEPLKTLETKREHCEYIHEVRNQGPGEMLKLDLYFAVPRDRVSQKLLTKPVFKPEPKEYLTDQWGQKVAHFQFNNLAPGKIAEVTMNVDVELRQTRFFLLPEKTGTLKDIPKEIRDRYLGDAGKFWINDPRIKKWVKENVGKEKNCYWIARKVFDFLGRKMHYNLDGSWNVAPMVLERGSGSCSEYSFSMIAMCRAAGLPARYVGSVVLRKDDASTDPGLFHRWPEVYLPNYGWVPMDPSSGRAYFPNPASRWAPIGNRRAGYLITTEGGGPSNLLQWDYNSHAEWQTKGPTRVFEERFGEWNPLPEPEGSKEKEKK